jgi:hypothetical protein
MKVKTAFSSLVFWICSVSFICAATQSPSVDSPIPLWSTPDFGMGSLSSSTLTQGKRPHQALLDTNHAGIAFLDDKHVIVHEVEVDPTQLSSRQSPDISSPFRLHAILLDASSGRLLLSKEWGTRAHESSVYVTNGGALLKTGNILRLLRSTDLEEYQKMTLPEPPCICVVSVSASQKTVLLNCFDQRENVSHFDDLDGSTLKTRYSWSESPPLYHHYSISDTAIAAVDFNKHKIIVSEFGSKRWNSIGEGSGTVPKLSAFPNLPTLVSDELLVDDRSEFLLISIDGRLLMASQPPTTDEISPEVRKIVVAQNGGFVAVASQNIDVRTHLFAEASMRTLSVDVAVYDLTLKQCVLNVEIAPLPTNDYDFALSPDGSTLAILNDRKISVYTTRQR